MKIEDYKRAEDVMFRIREWEKQIDELKEAAALVNKSKKKEDAEALTQLIMTLTKTPQGQRVVDYIASLVANEVKKAIIEYEQIFENI